MRRSLTLGFAAFAATALLLGGAARPGQAGAAAPTGPTSAVSPRL